ncbi:MAG: Ferredoxin, partial [uncultured Gemmatimonadaceae bacterium]
ALRHHRSLHQRQGPFVRGRLPRRLHLRGSRAAVHPPGRVHRLRRLRARVPRDGDLPGRGRAVHARAVRAAQPRRVQERDPAGAAESV